MAATLTRAELTARSRTVRVRTAAVIGAATPIIAGIPAGKRVCIWKITAGLAAMAAGPEGLQVSSCAAGANVDTNVHAQFPFAAASVPLEVGGDIESPFLIIQNATPAAGASANADIGCSHIAAPIDVTISYYLLP